MRLAFVVFALALVTAGAAASSDVWIREGGEPGVRASIAGAPLAAAIAPRDAILVDPTEPVLISIEMAAPPNETWEVRSVTVALLVDGPGSQAPAALTRTSDASATLPAGYTVVVNRSVDLASLQRVGAGTFLMRAQVHDADARELYSQEFYVRVPAGVGALLTVQGATITVVTAAAGYGLWQVVKDVKELRDAWARHRKRQERARLDVIGHAEHLVEETVAKGGRGLAGAVAIVRTAGDRERAWLPVRWAATGLGLGGVALAWAQFLGYVALDATGLVVVALEVAAAFLVGALLLAALVTRLRARGAEPARRVPVEGAPEAEAAEPVHPRHKRG